VIYAILAPNFNQLLQKAKLKTDIQTAKTLQQQLDLYVLESNKSLSDISSIPYKELEELGYIKSTDLDYSTGTGNEVKITGLKLQTSDAQLDYKESQVIITGVANNLYDSLSDSEKTWVSPVTSESPATTPVEDN
jgi:hypothetical protein